MLSVHGLSTLFSCSDTLDGADKYYTKSQLNCHNHRPAISGRSSRDEQKF
jgi:hypothetical protein